MKHSSNERAEGFGSLPSDSLPPPSEEIPGSVDSEFRGSYGLTQRAVYELRDIIRRECGFELTNQEAWARAIELVALARMIAEADIPEENPKCFKRGPEGLAEPSVKHVVNRWTLDGVGM